MPKEIILVSIRYKENSDKPIHTKRNYLEPLKLAMIDITKGSKRPRQK